MRVWLLGGLVLILAPLGGCAEKCGTRDRGCTASDTSAATEGSMTTDQRVYSAALKCSPVGHPCAVVSITITYRNPLDRPILLERCTPHAPTPLFLVVLADTTHASAPMNPGWACVGHDSPLVVPPGASRRDNIHLGLGPGPPATVGTVLGPFQIAYLARTAGGDTLPDSLRMSTPFRIRIEEAGREP